jgi:hypothetical protein
MGPHHGTLQFVRDVWLLTPRLIGRWAGRAWEKLCCGTETSAPYNFEASALSLGMLMTIDSSGDEAIRIQGLTEPYSFTDADGGSEGGESEVEEDPEEHADVEWEAEEEDDELEEEEEGEEAEEGEDESEEEDDTDPYWLCDDAPTEPPEGFVYAACPPLATSEDHSNLIGRKVLIAHERTKTLEPGWYIGKVKLFGVSAACAPDQRRTVHPSLRTPAAPPNAHIMCLSLWAGGRSYARRPTSSSSTPRKRRTMRSTVTRRSSCRRRTTGPTSGGCSSTP